jgi:hypothetical protein
MLLDMAGDAWTAAKESLKTLSVANFVDTMRREAAYCAEAKEHYAQGAAKQALLARPSHSPEGSWIVPMADLGTGIDDAVAGTMDPNEVWSQIGQSDAGFHWRDTTGLSVLAWSVAFPNYETACEAAGIRARTPEALREMEGGVLENDPWGEDVELQEDGYEPYEPLAEEDEGYGSHAANDNRDQRENDNGLEL